MSRIVLVALTVVLCGCSNVSALGPDDEGRAAEGGMVLSVALDRQTVQGGETARITTSLRNTNQHRQALTFAHGCGILYFVEKENGEIVAPAGGVWTCAAGGSSLSIGPGETITQVFRWTVAPAGEGTAEAQGFVPPGSYRVYATLDSDAVRLRTEPVGITVR